MPTYFDEVYPLVGFIVVLMAVVAYRLIPPNKTIDYRMLIPFAGTIKQENEPPAEVKARVAMMVLVSVVILASSLYTILFGTFPDATQNWAYGSIGTILGFWLKK